MKTLSHDDAWRMAMAAAKPLTGRVWLVEARDETGDVAGFRGSMCTQYEWINVQVYDPKSRAFADLNSTGGDDYAAYARQTRAALVLWTAIARCPGFSSRENPDFWLRVLREATPASHGQVSDVPRFFETAGVVFPRFRLTIQPRDCYDDDLHEVGDAVAWLDTFCRAFFEDEAVEKDVGELHEYAAQLAAHARTNDRQTNVHVQVVYRLPVLRTHGPLGSSISQHCEFLHVAHQLATQITIRPQCSSSCFSVLECLAVPRGSIHPSEFTAIANYFANASPLRGSGLCIDLTDEASLEEFTRAARFTRVDALTINVTNATVGSIEQLTTLLKCCHTIRSLRVFNAFSGPCTQRQEQWRRMGAAVRASHVQELVFERTHLNDDDVASFKAAFPLDGQTQLVSLTLKPIVSAAVSTASFVDLAKVFAASIEHLDLSALCLDSAQVESIAGACHSVQSLRLGTVDGLVGSKILEMLRERECVLSALAVSCSEADAREISDALASQSLDVALSGKHLKELSITIDQLESATTASLLKMLATNESLQYLHVKRRSHGVGTPVDERFTAHRRRQLVRKLPLQQKLAFLSVLGHAVTAGSALRRFDFGVASEIVGFAGHAVRRRFHCN